MVKRSISYLVGLISGLSLRYKLLALVLGPLLLLAGTVIYLAAEWSTAQTYKQLFAKVNTDLRVTHDIFQRIQSDRQQALSSLADNSVFLSQLEQNNYSGVIQLLDNQRHESGFDFVNLLSNNGSQRMQESGWIDWSVHESPSTQTLFGRGATTELTNTAVGLEIYPRAAWEAESELLTGKAVFPLIDTPRAAPTDKTIEDRAMVIRVLQRVKNNYGATLGVLEGGLLLNRNYAFVDEIRDLVYGPGSLAEGSRGTVTVFLDDVRITTNVPSNDDTRALGTRVSVEVRNTVLEHGTTWIDRAFVVNDWYISAYEPIVDVNGDRVGMLYAGFLEAPFREDLNKGIFVLAAIVLAGSLLAAAAATRGAKSIFKPVEVIAGVVRSTAAGERRRIGSLKVHDEIGELATQFDSMLDSLEEHSAQIEANANELEQKVQERTIELESKNTSLQESINMLHEAQQRLATAERLAAVGQLTAGVAHEINNPTAVILGNMDILIDELGEHSGEVQTEIDLIIEQVYRIRSITDRLLQYSRPNTTAPLQAEELADLYFSPNALETLNDEDITPTSAERVDVNELIEATLVLVKAELESKSVQLRKSYAPVTEILINRQELQQVIVNLIMNAIHAVELGGEVKVSTDSSSDGYVNIVVQDNGVGVAVENINRLFDPFFTHGKEGGTGLGLSVSYGIVKRHHGTIEVVSAPGEGAAFTVKLPADVELHSSTTTPAQSPAIVG